MRVDHGRTNNTRIANGNPYVDRPLVIRKEGQPAIIPHENWRGQFSRGTYTSGAVSDCGPGQTTGCTAIAWPGYRTNAWHARNGDGPDIRTWFGGLVDGQTDRSAWRAG